MKMNHLRWWRELPGSVHLPGDCEAPSSGTCWSSSLPGAWKVAGIALVGVLAFAGWGSSVLVQANASRSDTVLSLAGSWGFAGDPDDVGVSERWFFRTLDADAITLPGTTDDLGYGTPHGLQPELPREVLRVLARKHSYVGPAWYQKTVTIPEAWAGRAIVLSLERVMWETRVWVGERPAGAADSLITPHVYDLTELLTPGTHRLTIRVDNSRKYNLGNMAHAYSHETQIMWNGLIGGIRLEAVDPVHLEEVQLYPNIAGRTVRAVLTISNRVRALDADVALEAAAVNGQPHVTPKVRRRLALVPGQTVLEVELPMGPEMQLWDEFSPVLYELTAKIAAAPFEHSKSVRFGMRQIEAEGARLLINRRPLFLRGTLECCIFPNTGHPPMDKAEWKRIIGIAQSYGLNHFRFHSWCPPRAAFEAADELGFYLQPELPVWVNNMGRDEPRDQFLKAEADRLMKAYGNHPSYVLLVIGNELEGDYGFIHSLVRHFQENDPRRLYTSTAFSFQGQHGRWPEPVDEFFITQQTTNGWVRGQGFFNVRPPSTSFDFRDSLAGMPVPVISHEIGQYAVFPNLQEIDQYTGVNEPMNLKAIRADLERKGLLPLADDYLQASGQLSVLLYKEDIEMCLRTPGMSGFQLLDLHDFPGQGTALVGTLNAFWESKGLIKPEAYRRFCNSTVPLARLAKRTFENSEVFEAAVEVLHYAPANLIDAVGLWRISDHRGQVLLQDRFHPVTLVAGGHTALGTIRFPLGQIKNASKLVLTVALEGTEFINDWAFWVYPADQSVAPPAEVLIAGDFDENVVAALGAGRTVLLLPEPAALREKEMGRFVPVFWSPVHFPNQPITMGLLCDPAHPVFRHFPTDFHTDWQWWELMTQSAAVLMDGAPQEFEPLVRMVDGFTKNRRLYNLFEACVGGGKLVFCSMDIVNDLDQRIAARQLRRSLLAYVGSADFDPQQSLPLAFVKGLFREATPMTGARILGASSEQPGYEGRQAVDGEANSLWHSAWSPQSSAHPHDLRIQLREEMTLTGFTYLPRQDGNANGRVAEYEFYVSLDGTDWGRPVAAGTFSNDAMLKNVVFQNAESVYGGKIRAGYVRFVALKGFGTDSHASAAEINLITE